MRFPGGGSGLVKTKFPVQGKHGALHGVCFHHERYVVLGGTLGDGDDVDSFPSERRKRAPRNSWYTVHVFANHCDDGNAGIGGNVLYGLLGDFGSKGMAQSFDGAFLVRGGDHETDVILRGRLRDEQHIGAQRRRRRE